MTDPAAAPVLLPPWEPLGRSLLAYLDGDPEASAVVLMEGGRVSAMQARQVCREDGFPPAEELALDLARGRVLDLGAGAGSHTLELQRDGHPVVALDVARPCVEAMTRRGVADPRLGDVYELAGERFDTVLMMMNGAGLCADLAGLDRFLVHAHTLLADGGAVLLDSSDLRRTDDDIEQSLIAERQAAGRYFGVAQFQMGFAGDLGEPFPWLFVDAETLAERAAPLGWHTQVLFDDPAGAFLARLTPSL